MSFFLPLPRLIIQCNFASIIILILLSTFIFTNVSFTKKVNARFIAICFCTLLLTISDNTRFITAHLPQRCFLRYLSAATGYTIRPIIIYLIASIAGRRNESKLKFWVKIPLFINGILAFMSCFTPFHGLMFDFDIQNKFVRGYLGFIPYLCSACYIILILYFLFKQTVVNKSEAIIIVVNIGLGIVATVMESIWRFDLILSQVLIVGTVFYYLFLNVQAYKHDSLTQLEKRHCFYLEIEKLKKSNFILISLDLNNLKLYNDTLGHAAGDKALVTCTEYMSKHFVHNCRLFRIGGDEFMCICKGYTKSEVEELVAEFQKDLGNTIYKVACGIAEYHAGDDMDKIISISDAAMYENKKALKNE